VRLLTVEGTVVLTPYSHGVGLPPPPSAHLDGRIMSEGIGARLGPSAQLINESINDLRSLDH
jgi:hypothetical protein